jgi:hypothetical protein
MLHTLENTIITFLPDGPKQTSRNQVPNLEVILSQPISPAKEQILNTTGQNPQHAKGAKDKAPQFISE